MLFEPYRTPRQKQQLFTKRDAARYLDADYMTFFRFVQQGLLPEPAREHPGHVRPYYSADDLAQLKQMWDNGDWIGDK